MLEVREYVFEMREEDFESLEELLFDINPVGFVFERGRNGTFLKVYDESIVEFLKKEGYEPSKVRETRPEDWISKELKKPFKLIEGVIVDPVGNYEGDGIVLRINPGVAFGTGLHPTTRMCARLLKENLKPGMDVLDIGTGSGILAILSKKLGARYVLGVDNDPVAIESAIENASNSGVDVEFRMSDLLSNVSGKFDIVVANIVPHVLLKLSEDLRRVLKDGSVVILSGIDEGSQDEVKRAYSYLELVEEMRDGEWVSLMLRSSRDSSRER